MPPPDVVDIGHLKVRVRPRWMSSPDVVARHLHVIPLPVAAAVVSPWMRPPEVSKRARDPRPGWVRTRRDGRTRVAPHPHAGPHSNATPEAFDAVDAR